jgi:hypothetical protein
MAKEDKRSLLAKVVKFVRNPTTDWADLDQASTFEPSGHSQLMLKEMMERKKRNDFVRRREFDMLRKIRRREQVQGAMPVERASFFQSSLPSNQAERANTLKKSTKSKRRCRCSGGKPRRATAPWARFRR